MKRLFGVTIDHIYRMPVFGAPHVPGPVFPGRWGNLMAGEAIG
jgi:prolipoprotein diacylglyceryltransferase